MVTGTHVDASAPGLAAAAQMGGQLGRVVAETAEVDDLLQPARSAAPAVFRRRRSSPRSRSRRASARGSRRRRRPRARGRRSPRRPIGLCPSDATLAGPLVARDGRDLVLLDQPRHERAADRARRAEDDDLHCAASAIRRRKKRRLIATCARPWSQQYVIGQRRHIRSFTVLLGSRASSGSRRGRRPRPAPRRRRRPPGSTSWLRCSRSSPESGTGPGATGPAGRPGRVTSRMDLIPKPDQVVSAASNVAHKMLYGGLADLRPMPRTLIDEGVLREVYHYRPAATAREHGDPVLLVTPLAAPALCFDLRRGCSLVEHFVDAGPADVPRGVRRGLLHATAAWAWSTGSTRSCPRRSEEVSAHAGGRPVHVVGWSLGGIFALLTAADRPDLPIASLTVVGAPVDVTQVPLVAPLRPLLDLTDGARAGHPGLPAAGRRPEAAGARAFQLSSFQKLVTKPLAIAAQPRRRRLPRPDRGGRPVHREHDRLPRPDVRAALPPAAQGQRARDRRGRRSTTARSTLADITAPVLVFAGATDGIAPVAVPCGRSSTC